VATATPEHAGQHEPECPSNAPTRPGRVSFARADSSARALLMRAGIDARDDCAGLVKETDSSVILGYSHKPPVKSAVADGQVLHYGGGIVIEVLSSGQAKWLYATQ